MVFDTVRTIIAEQFNVSEDTITLETSLTNDIGADSLDVFQIISELEEIYDIEFSHDSVEQMKTIADTVEYITVNTRK
jgi:acyl carrier protein